MNQSSESITDKSKIRKMIRDRRRGLTDQQREAGAFGLLNQLLALDDFHQSEMIAMYLVNDGEIDPLKVIHWCWKNNKQTFVPVVIQQGSNSLLFAEIKKETKLKENRYGIPEPDVDVNELVQAAALDLVLMPLVAFDDFGNRVGMGGGFYDTTFEFIKDEEVRKPLLIGIAHEVQKVEKIEVESWDIPLTRIVTGSKIYGF
jgi:5-formyltetrahydrofolate cyclo-ligase